MRLFFFPFGYFSNQSIFTFTIGLLTLAHLLLPPLSLATQAGAGPGVFLDATFFDEKDGLPSMSVSCLCVMKDSAGKTMIAGGGDKGLFFLDSERKFTVHSTLSGLPSNRITSLCFDGERLWVGTDEGAATWGGREFSRLGLLDGLPNLHVYQIKNIGSEVWILTMGGIARYVDAEFVSKLTPAEGLAAKDAMDAVSEGGNVYIALFGGGIDMLGEDGKISHLTSRDGLPSDLVASVAAFRNTDTGGLTLFAAVDQGLARLDWPAGLKPEAGAKPEIRLIKPNKRGLTSPYLRHLFMDGKQLFISTFGGGVCRYDATTSLEKEEFEGFIAIAQKDSELTAGKGNRFYMGLSDNRVNMAAADGENLYFATEKGMTITDKRLRDASKQLAEYFSHYTNYEFLQMQINLLNFLNGMYLSDVQLEKLLELSRKAEELRVRYNDEKLLAGVELEKTLGRLKSAMLSDETTLPGPVTAAGLEKYASALCREAQNRKNRFNRAIIGLECELFDVFSDEQRQILGVFAPCVIPPLDQKEPVRIGQAGNAYKELKVLCEIRKLDDSQFGETREALIRAALENAENEFGLIGDSETLELHDLFGQTLDRARKLSELEFQIEKWRLAAVLNKENNEAYLKNKLLSRLNRIQFVPGKMAYLFLSQFSIPIIERRLESIRKERLKSQERLKLSENKAKLN